MIAIKKASTSLIFGRFVSNDDFARMRYLAQEASAASMARDEEKEKAERADAEAKDARKRAEEAEKRAKDAEFERIKALNAVDRAKEDGRKEGRALERRKYSEQEWEVIEALHSLHRFKSDVYVQGDNGEEISVADFVRDKVMQEIKHWDTQAVGMQRSRGARSR